MIEVYKCRVCNKYFKCDCVLIPDNDPKLCTCDECDTTNRCYTKYISDKEAIVEVL